MIVWALKFPVLRDVNKLCEILAFLNLELPRRLKCVKFKIMSFSIDSDTVSFEAVTNASSLNQNRTQKLVLFPQSLRGSWRGRSLHIQPIIVYILFEDHPQIIDLLTPNHNTHKKWARQLGQLDAEIVYNYK